MSDRAERGRGEAPDAGAERDRAVALDRLEAAIGYPFRDRGRLEAALRHSSWAYERTQATRGGAAVASNERLEFLGDAVLALVVADALFAAQPDWPEGDLTRALHAIVEGASLADWATSLELGPALRLGRTEEISGGHEKPSILEDAMEALIGSIYLDGGLEPVRRLVAERFGAIIESDRVPIARDPKTALQEALMAEVGTFPTYRLAADSGVEGDEDRFETAVVLDGEELGRGVGRTKRAAEKAAAQAALAHREEAGRAEGEP